ncbi:hypothetical protein LINPERPRIM_LOCUS13130 [Linum perenne]
MLHNGFSLQSHPKASGLNNKPLPIWEDLCIIFGLRWQQELMWCNHVMRPARCIPVVAPPTSSTLGSNRWIHHDPKQPRRQCHNGGVDQPRGRCARYQFEGRGG